MPLTQPYLAQERLLLFLKGSDSVANINLPQEVIDALAEGEAQALLDGLKDPELRQSPAFLAKVRQFLKDNDFYTTTEVPGVKYVKQEVSKIPDLIGDDFDA